MQLRTPRMERMTLGGGRRGARLALAVSIAAVLPLSLLHGFRLVESLTAASLPLALLGLAAGALTADLVTGLVHWACDTWGSERTPWVGPELIRSFREHHRDPRAMLAHDWVEVNGEVAMGAAVGFLALALPPARAFLGGAPFLAGFSWALLSVAALANQLHWWSHSPAAPPLVRTLQRRGWILSPARHALHHRPPHTRGYCIATGWLNGTLDGIGFWRGLERMVCFATGASPRRESRDGAGPSDRAAAAPPRRGRSLGCQ